MKIVWSEGSWQDYSRDRVDRERVDAVLRDIALNGHTGIGRPVPLQLGLAGYWSRRISAQERLIYKIDEAGILVISCRYRD